MLLALVATALLAGGCASAASTRDEPVLSKREYIAEANELQQDAAAVFSKLNGRLAATPAQAKVHLAAFDGLIAGYEALDPPRDWADEHAQLLESLATMRQSVLVVSRASARNRGAVTAQVARYRQAQDDFEAAVQSINASR